MSVLTQPRGQIAIGWAVINGERVPVVCDPEWIRFFSTLTDRVGGATGVSTSELVESAYDDAGIEEVKLGIYNLRDELNQLPRVAEMQFDDLLPAPYEPIAFDDPLTPATQQAQADDPLPQIQALADQIAELQKSIQALQQGLTG